MFQVPVWGDSSGHGLRGVWSKNGWEDDKITFDEADHKRKSEMNNLFWLISNVQKVCYERLAYFPG